MSATVPERDPQKEVQPDATEGKDRADYDSDVDNKGSEPEVKQSAQKQKKVNPDAEYAEMEITQVWDPPPKDDALGSIYGDPVDR